MSIAEQINKAEASIIKTMGVDATFKTYNNQVHHLKVLPKADNTEINLRDFRTRGSSTHFEALAEDIPTDWRDGKLDINEITYNVIDIIFDSYNVRAEIMVD